MEISMENQIDHLICISRISKPEHIRKRSNGKARLLLIQNYAVILIGLNYREWYGNGQMNDEWEKRAHTHTKKKQNNEMNDFMKCEYSEK